MRSNLIFDLDNTLLDFSASERAGLTKTFADFGVTDNAQIRAIYEKVNTGLWAQLERGEITREQLLARRFNTFLAAIDRSDLPGAEMEHEYRGLLNSGHQRVPGAKTLLTALHQNGYTILAGTNGNTATQKQRLHDSHLAPLFDGIYISEEIGYDKPAPQFFDAIFAHEHELHKDDTLMIGDGLNSDIRGGVNYGLRTIWVNLHDQINKTGLQPTLEVHSLNELENKLLASA
ncbi:YjjG family noncanonical pyrimidine nucleotidase [Lacticaseibacillus pabuli]|uniref:YjjG family noncanonical pyrimidine nucleotidase n=1 Tax=Lacticaseibacillus pabuli TaxID=3025672 RepID=A0ABY7WTI4_9LACO|nr:YjjG family noncanonical pyrimidine nucleotidase [Lacticaseibacillus sp. KACC 23028]WDF83477.1 YjjG family noncanonical pyrimidine nucleotidase [Lacticaseibacillus sp. KACC 23028]